MTRSSAGAGSGDTGGGAPYTLPLAANGTRGGVQIGYTTSASAKKYAVQLDSEKMYVEVTSYPWASLSDKPATATRWPTFDEVTSKPDTATRWPTWAEVSGKPTSKTAWGQTYVDSSGNLQSINGNMSNVGHIAAMASDTYDVGSSSYKFRSGYFGTALYMGDIEIAHSNEINTAAGSTLYLQYRNNGQLVLCHNGANVGIDQTSPAYKLDVNGVIYSNTGVYSAGYVTALSDARKKDVLGDITLSAEQIAEMPAVRFSWIDKSKPGIFIGTLAQPWQKLLPEAVHTMTDGVLSFDYQSAAIVAVINLAKEIAAIKSKLKKYGFK